MTTSGFDWPDENKMVFEYRIREGCSAFESKRLVLVFHGLTPEQQRIFHFENTRQAVQVGGDGTSSVSTTHVTDGQSIEFDSHYANGTNTLRFGNEIVRFVQGGNLLLTGERAVDLRGQQKVVHLNDGKVTLE